MPSVIQKDSLTNSVKLNSKYGLIVCPTAGKIDNQIENTFYTFKVKNNYIDKKSIITLTTNSLTIDGGIVSIPSTSINSIGHNKFYITFHIGQLSSPGTGNTIDNDLIIYFRTKS